MKHRQQEIWRLLLFGLAGVLAGVLSGHWLASFLVVSLIYAAWFWYRLCQISQWLQRGADSTQAPDVSGAWENIVYHIHNLQRTSKARKAKLRALVDQLQGIIAKLPYATVVLDQENHIQWFNPKAIPTLGLNPNTDPGQRLDNLLRVPAFQEFLASHNFHETAGAESEITLQSSLGNTADLAIQLIPVNDELRLLIARDISDQVRVQHIRRNFIANASHELRSPLTVISGYLEMLLDTPGLPDAALPMLRSAADQSQRMQSLVEDLLTISRLENTSIKPENMRPVALATCIRRHIAGMEKTNQHAHRFTFRLEETLIIHGNESELESVVSNLITNAIRHTPPETLIRITWSQTPSGDACLSVKDNGPGIAAQHLPHLTERFYRVDKGRSKDSGGTGLGLSIVQHIVNRHRGRLEIHSEPGKGAEFRVIFPANLVQEQHNSQPHLHKTVT